MDLSGWVVGLADDELALLAEALDTRRLPLDASPSLLRSYGWPEGWAAPLGRAAEAGVKLPTLAACVAVAQRERQRGRQRRVDLACTRPSGGKVDVLDTSVAVRRLFIQAEREVLVAGFRVNDREMLEPLRRTASRPIDVRLFVDIDPAYAADGAKQAPPGDLDLWPRTWWSQFMEHVWPTYMAPPRCWYAPSTLGPDKTGRWRSMHAKSIVVDRRWWFVTSANFTRRGHERNIELGALIEDPERAAEVIGVFEDWAGAGVFVPVAPPHGVVGD